MPKFSVIVTTHDRPLFLRRAIQSIKAQTCPDIQTIVVSDSPCPETQRIASSLLDRSDLFILRHGSCGPAASRNAGLRVADGRFIAFLDDDDAFTDTFFEDVSPHLDRNIILYTNYHVVFERSDGSATTPFAASAHDIGGRDPADLYVKNFIPLHCLIYPAEVAKSCAVDPTLELNEDWDFVLQAAGRAKLRHHPINGPVIYTRETADNRGNTRQWLLEDVYRRVYAAHPAPNRAIEAAREVLMGDARPIVPVLAADSVARSVGCPAP